MDKELLRYINLMIEECTTTYGVDRNTTNGKRLVIVYLYNKLLQLMPFDGAIMNGYILSGIAEAFGINTRSVRFHLVPSRVEYKRAEYITRVWETHIWDVGTSHYVRDLEWYKKQSYLLKKQHLLTQKKQWKKERYGERLMLAGKPVVIIKNENNKIRVAQDCGVNEWSILELMGREIVNEEQGASDTDCLC